MAASIYKHVVSVVEWSFLGIIFSFSLSKKRANKGGVSPWTALWTSVARNLNLPISKLCSFAWSTNSTLLSYPCKESVGLVPAFSLAWEQWHYVYTKNCQSDGLV